MCYFLLASAVALQLVFRAGQASEEEEGGDDDESELDYNEWLQVLARCCDVKMGGAKLNGEPFEYVLMRWLQTEFIPRYKALLKKKARTGSVAIS